MYEKMMFTNDKKNLYMSGANFNNLNQQPPAQNGLLPRISNLRNEVTILFKNSNGNQNP